MNNEIPSPCMKICIFDQDSGYCLGCSRTEDEVIKWKDPATSNEWKKDNLNNIRKRLTGWQLESFNESYEYKINNGISLFKKNLINE